MVLFGVRMSGRVTTVREYFLSGGRVPTWALFGSIVATETSTVTLISVPGFAFGGDLTFLPLAVGYIFGKILVAVFLIPAFFRGRYLTAYQLVEARFGPVVGRLTALTFLASRSLSDGFRLFATGLVVAAVLSTWPGSTRLVAQVTPAGADPATVLVVVAIGLLGITTLAYTLLGGMRAVIWTDVVQLVVYMCGAIIALAILWQHIPGGWTEVMTRAHAAGKLRVWDLSLDPARSYTLWSGLVGGMFLTAGTHGTDQMFVQRYLASGSASSAARALVWSGVFVLAQLGVFLAIGLMLWVYYTGYAPAELAALTIDGVVRTDRIFPAFMVDHLPIGLRGLVLAAIVAAAMSTLSSSLNSSAASTLGDFYQPLTRRDRTEQHYVRVSRLFTVGWAVIQVAVAVGAIWLSQRVVDEVLGIQSFTLGTVLGTFWLVRTSIRSSRSALTGIAAGALILTTLRLGTDVSWQWYVLVGSISTWAVGCAAARWGEPPDAAAEAGSTDTSASTTT